MSEKCACRGDYLDKMIQPAILGALYEKPAHGFSLLTAMMDRGLAKSVDAAGFYRTLRRLEDDGKLISEWQIEQGEKPKKVYSITEEGRACLRNWQVTLRDYLSLVERIAESVDYALR